MDGVSRVARFQVRKRGSQWEVWVLKPGARAWELLDNQFTWAWAMMLATGQFPYGAHPGWKRVLSIAWQPT